MKIAKYLNHFGVDKMLKAALGGHLEIFRKNPDEWADEQVGVTFTKSDVRDEDWDIFIFDDHYTILRFLQSGAKARHYVWYCHGTFTEWAEPRNVFNEQLSKLKVSIIYTDDFKRSLTDTWREFLIQDSITQPIALSDASYSTCLEKTGRISLIGNNYARVCHNYPRYETFAKPCMDWLMAAYSDTLDVYGYNDTQLEVDVFGEFGVFRRGPAKISEKSSLSASIQLSATASIGFVLAESFTAGIPVVATPKYQLPSEGWKCVQTVEQLQQEVERLAADPLYAYQLGLAGQQMYRERFSFDSYREKLTIWLERQC